MLSDDEDADDEDSDDEDSDAPNWNIPEGRLGTAHWSARYTLKTYGRLLQTLRQHTDPLSARDIMSYIDGHLVNGHLVY